MQFKKIFIPLACAALLQDEPACDIATLIAPEADASDRANPDVVKAVVAMEPGERHGRALYFTRSTLYGDAPIWRHIGRALEMGLQIWAAVIDEAPLSVDNPDDLAAARALAR